MKSTAIRYVKGDATQPQGPGMKILAHVCNDVGGWGAGFVLALSARWEEPARYYRRWHKSGKDFELGQVQFVPVRDKLVVANMLAQSGYSVVKQPALRYDALRQCLHTVAEYCALHHAEMIGPRFGAGLAGGNWSFIERIIEEELCQHGIPVTIYDL